MKTILHIYNTQAFYEQLRQKGAETIEKLDNQWVINGTPIDNEKFCAIVNDPNARFEALFKTSEQLSQEEPIVVKVTKKKRVRKQKNKN